MLSDFGVYLLTRVKEGNELILLGATLWINMWMFAAHFRLTKIVVVSFKGSIQCKYCCFVECV